MIMNKKAVVYSGGLEKATTAHTMTRIVESDTDRIQSERSNHIKSIELVDNYKKQKFIIDNLFENNFSGSSGLKTDLTFRLP